EAMLAALKLVESQSGKEWDIVIGGDHIKTEKKIKSINPSNPGEVVGISQSGSKEMADRAVKIAAEKFEEWRFTSAEERAGYLFKAASIMRRRKMELAATMVLEIGKNWLEAVGDVAEAIDFMEFYAREMLRLSQPQPLTPSPGEILQYHYIPLGVGVVIPPWNFPLAILVGMTSASLVAGNTVVLKPASITPIIGAKFMEIMEEAKLPDGVLNFLPGGGGAIGDTLVDHPLTRFINFTGSKEVGLRILERAAKIQPGQKWIKRVTAEMGGKDALIIDSEADLDIAVDATVAGAFGFQGQKCSACSRLIVDEKVYNEVVERLVERTSQLTVGPVKDQKNYMGPISSAAQEEKILEYVEIGKQEAKLVTGGNKLDMPGYFVEPTIFIDADRKSRLAQEEIFGPVLTVIKAKDFDDALEIANDSEYGLTGGFITNNRQKIEKGKRVFFAGNLYINRKITGALVDVQPFGGYNMSGTCSKAGGRDYLILFMQGKSITERL
ncbi:MAG: L-glutamate gamma-semialdehyde dehydrogenase, partial [Calditrichia bacterium]